MKAVVMAGGRGTRLAPLTRNQPKPLMPVAGRPMLHHVLRLLEQHGIGEAIVTAQYHAGQIQDYLAGLKEFSLEISCVVEEAPLGTAGGFGSLAHRLRTGPFLVISGDTLTDCDLTALIDHHRSVPALVTAALADVEDPSGLGVVTTDEQGRIDRFVEKPEAGTHFSTLVNTGIYVVDPVVLDRIPAGRATDWAHDVFPALVEERSLHGWSTDAYWEDVGTHARYFQAQVHALTGKVKVELEFPQVSPGVHISHDVRLPPDVTLLGPLHIGAGARVGDQATLANGTVLGRDVAVGAGAILEGAICHDAASIGAGSVLVDCVVGHSSRIGASVRIGRGTVIAAHSAVPDGTVVPEGSRIGPTIPAPRRPDGRSHAATP